MNKTRLIKDTITTSILNVVGKGIGYLVPLFIARAFGVGERIDVFFYAYSIIFFISMVFSTSFENVVVPFVAEIKLTGDKEKLSVFVSKVGMLLFCFLSVILVISFFIFRFVVNFITNFTPDQIMLLSKLFVSFIPFLYFICFASLTGGVLNAAKRFGYPAVSPAVRAVVVIVAIFLTKDRFGIFSIPIGYNIGELLRLGFLLFVAYRERIFNIKLCFQFDRKIIELFSKAVFLVLSVVVVGMNPIVDNTVASWLSKGSISILEYSNKLAAIPFSFVTYGFLVVFLSHLSHNIHAKGIQAFKKELKSYIKPVIIVSIIVAVLLCIFSKHIVYFCFGQKAFSSQQLNMVSLLFLINLIGFMPYMVIQLFVRGFLALRATRILLYVSIWKFSLNVILDIIFVRIWGLKGIMIATTVIQYVLLFVIIYYFRKHMISRENVPATK